jgi:hypothetical protein
MDKNLYYPLLSLVLVILVAGAVYTLAGAFGGTEAHEGGEHGGAEVGEGAEFAEQLFFDAIENPLQYSEYTYAYEEVSSTGYGSSVFLSVSENYSYVRKEDAIFTRELLIADNKTLLCLENTNRRVCSWVSQNSSFKPYADSIKSLLFNREVIESNLEKNEFFIQYGALVFSDDVHEAEYGGRKCNEVSYLLDYGKLTVEQMWEIGLSPNSVEVLVTKEFNFTLCIDENTGDVVHKLLAYTAMGEPYYTESLSTKILWGEPTPLEMGAELSGEADMEEFLSALRMSQENYLQCLYGEDTDSCIRGEAILSRNENLCELVVNSTIRDICFVNVALEKGEDSLCSMVSGENLDECFMEFAYKNADASYCGMVSESRRDECMGLIEEASSQNSSEASEGQSGEGGEVPPEGGGPGEESQEAGADEPEMVYGSECSVDSDCAVASSCQYKCVPSYWSDVATTCEDKPEYECLGLTSCGCVEGKCAWDENEEYSSCAEGLGGS